jgi:hypothetical protein
MPASNQPSDRWFQSRYDDGWAARALAQLSARGQRAGYGSGVTAVAVGRAKRNGARLAPTLVSGDRFGVHCGIRRQHVDQLR